MNGWPVGYCVFVALVVTVALAQFGCRSKPSIEGFYLRYGEHEAGKEWDTLVIKGSGTDAYHVTRKWQYERVLDGAALTPEYKVFHSTVVWLRKEGLLVEEETGLRYLLKGETLQVGETHYKKVK